MSISASISRLTVFYRRHGLRATAQRAALALKRILLLNRTVLFYCELPGQASCPPEMPPSVKVERKKASGEIRSQDLQDMTNFWNPKLAHWNINERFGQGASLWLIKCEGKLAGFGWSLRGRTIEPHYFPLGQDDVHLFDFHVFPEYRGRGINPILVAYILRNVAAECAGRAFIEAAEWNYAQLSSLMKTPFRRFGCAWKFRIFRRTVVCWSGDPNGDRLVA